MDSLSHHPTDRTAAAESLCRVAGELYARRLCEGTSGNFSAVLVADPLQLLITRSRCDKGRLTPEDTVLVGVDGKALPGESGNPSAEALLHTTIATLTGARSVLHTHSIWGTLLSRHYCDAGGFVLTGYEMLKGIEGIDTHRAEVFVPVVENTQDMRRLASQIVELHAEWPNAAGFLISGHGLYTWGESIGFAQRHVEIFEFLFECVGRTLRLDTEPAPPGS